jgi:hypothetical protein
MINKIKKPESTRFKPINPIKIFLLRCFYMNLNAVEISETILSTIAKNYDSYGKTVVGKNNGEKVERKGWCNDHEK